MELLRGDQTTRRGVRLACGVIALAALALAACNNETQTGPIGANTLVFVGTVNGDNATLSGSAVLTIDETRVAATFKIRTPSADAGTAANEAGTASGIAPGDNGTATDEAGTATGTQTSTTLQDITKTWTVDVWKGRPVSITAGTGVGQTRTVSSNTANTLTVSAAWTTTPDGTSDYAITQTSTTLQDITKTWTVDLYKGAAVSITAGTGAGQTSTVSSNTTNTLTVSPGWTTTPDGTSAYVITRTNTLQDNTKTWATDVWKGRTDSITLGTGAGQAKAVSSNNANTLVLASAWTTPPDNTSQYVIKILTSTTLGDPSKSWTKNEWAAQPVFIAAGTGAGQTRTVSSNSENILTVSPAWTKTPDGTSQYLIETTIAITGTYNTSSKAFSATGGGYTFDGAYDGSSRLQGTFTGPTLSGTFLTERATNGPKAYCGTFTSTTAGENGIFNVTLHGAILFGMATGDAGTVLALDGTVSGSGVTVVNPNAPTGPPLAIGTVSTDGSSVAGTFDDGAGNMGNWQGARCDL